jgi:lysophospholipase L1-like esterase
MPTINITPKAMQNGDNVTTYKDTVGPQQQTYTFLTSQERVILKNSGSKNITYTVGSQSGTLGPSQMVDVKETISSINLTAEQGTQQFEIWADEAGTKGTSPEAVQSLGDQVSGFASSLADKATQSQTEKAGLSGWLRDFSLNRNKKITTIGDSTSDNTTGAQYIWSEITSFFTGSGDLLEGITFTHRGANGNTLSNFLVNTPTGKGIDDAIADQSDLYIFSYGINDVRLGATSQQQLIDMLDKAIQSLLKNTKGYILLRIPNSFLLDDPGNTGWLQPLSSAQAYTDLIWNAYMSFKGKYSRVDILDMQTLIFGRTCNTLANSPLMNDVLHPNVGGYRRIGRLISNYIGVQAPIRDDLINKAVTDNPSKPYLVYPKYSESRPDLYELVAQGYFVGMGSNYIDFAFDPTIASNVVKGGYILKVGDKLIYDLPSNVSPIATGANTRLLNVSFPDYANNNKGMVKVFRLKAVAPTKSINFYGTNMNGVQFPQYYSLNDKSTISNIVATLKSNIPNAMTFDVKHSHLSTDKKLGTLSTAVNNMSGTFVWNTTDYPNSNALIDNIDYIYLVCTSSGGYTGEIVLRVGLS